ncbi:MAG: PKD domain-containing protein [Bacteroidales bacterium]|nr:PKD domain-containing protein [Bacteroidales bacterium]
MKKKVFIPVLVIISILFFTLSSCSKKDNDNETQNKPPSCIITTPATGQEIVTGTLLTIAVDADDADGSIAEVRFYVDDIGKGTAGGFPYNYSWNTAGETAGNHTIKAMAIDNAGARVSDEVDIVLVEAQDAPLAEFSATPLSGVAPLNVSFTDLSTNNPTSWQWDFGDGNNSTEQNPNHTYYSAGTYPVQLTVVNELGSDTEIKTDYITATATGNPPIAGFTATPTNGIAPLLVSFIDQSDNDPVSWQWDFGDGTVSTLKSPLHTYDATGTYSVSLTVENSQGSDTEVKSDYIVVVFGGGTGEPCPGIPMLSYGGQLYNTVLINDQCWLKENLNIGSMISSTQSQSNNGGIEKYCYDNNEANCDIYGGLYQWDEIMQYISTEGTQGICPPGWHIPTNGEWIALTDHLGGDFVAGGKMKETGTVHWNSPNTGATNSSNFTALPGGRFASNVFDNMGRYAYIGSSTEGNTLEAYRLMLYYNFTDVFLFRGMKNHGLSVRCLKD